MDEENAGKSARMISLIFVILSGLFIIMTRSFFSITLLAFSLPSLLFTIINVCSYEETWKKSECYSSFLFINEWLVWFGVFGFFYLFGSFNDFLFPLYIAASDKAYWDSSYWYNMSYGVFYGFFITFLVLFIIVAGAFSIIAIFAFADQGSRKDNFHRETSSLIIMELLVALGLAFLLRFEGLWLSSYFPGFLYVTIVLTFCLIIYLLITMTYDNAVFWGMPIIIGIVAVFHLVVMIILFSNINYLYATTPAIFSYGFDSGYLSNSIGVEKFNFTGDAQALTACPKSLTVFNWEDPSNQFGCLNMEAFYRGRNALCLLLDLLIALPFCEGLMSFILFLNEILDNEEDWDYEFCQESSRRVISWIISIGFITGIITVLCLSSFTKSAYFVYSSFYSLTLDHTQLLNQIIPATQLNYLTFDSNEEVLPKYYLQGTIYDFQVSEVLFEYKAQDSSTPEAKEILTGAPFTISKLNSFPNTVPKTYTYRVLEPTTKEVFNTGSFIVGGLLTGRYIQLGQIPLKPNQSQTGTLNGIIYELTSVSPIQGAAVFVVKGQYYPSSIKELLNNETDFKPDNIIKSLKSDLNGMFVFSDIPLGSYTLVIYKPGYYIETISVGLTVDKEVLNFPRVYLSKINSEVALEIRLDWPTNVDLNLFASFPFKDGQTCLIGYVNHECGRGKFTSSSSQDKRQGGFEMITFDKIGQFDYSFYVHNYQRRSQTFISTHFTKGFMPDEPIDTTSKIDLEKTQAKVKVYLPEFKYPLLNDNVPFNALGKQWNVFDMKAENAVLKFSILDKIA